MKSKLTALENGPLELVANKQIIFKDGVAIEAGEKVLLCTCGQSGTKPFCDFTHVGEGFTSVREIDTEILLWPRKIPLYLSPRSAFKSKR